MSDVSKRSTISRRYLTFGSAMFVASAAVGHASAQGTPVAEGETGPDRLASLLSLVPASFAETGGFTWCDISSQAASVGVAMPTGLPQEVSAEFVAALGVLPLSSVEPGSPLDPDTHERFGFSGATAHQELSFSGGSFGPKLLRGGLPVKELPAWWEAAGYARETTLEGIDIWSVPGFPSENATGPNVASPPDWLFAILDDILVMGRDLEASDGGVDIGAQIAAIIIQATTGGESFLDAGGYQALLDSLAPDTVAVIATPGDVLDIENFAILPPGQTDVGSPRRRVEEDPNQVPLVLDVAYAITGGGRGQGFAVSNAPGTPGATPLPPSEPDPGDAIVQARLRFASAEDARQAITTIETSWNMWDSVTLEVPYADLLSIEVAQSDPSDATIAAIDFRPIGTPDNWLYIFLNGDVLPFAYRSGTSVASPPA